MMKVRKCLEMNNMATILSISKKEGGLLKELWEAKEAIKAWEERIMEIEKELCVSLGISYAGELGGETTDLVDGETGECLGMVIFGKRIVWDQENLEDVWVARPSLRGTFLLRSFSCPAAMMEKATPEVRELLLKGSQVKPNKPAFRK